MSGTGAIVQPAAQVTGTGSQGPFLALSTPISATLNQGGAVTGSLPITLTKGADGYFTASLPTQTKGTYTYSMLVDGVKKVFPQTLVVK